MNRALSLVVLLVAASVVGWGISMPVIEYKNLTGNQAWSGALSFAFEVKSPVTVDALGTFDSGADGLKRDIYVEIRRIKALGTGTCTSPCAFSSVGTTLDDATLASASFTTSGSYPLLGGARWQGIAPVTLATGYYMLTAVGYGDGELNYNTHGGSSTHLNSLSTFGGRIGWGIGPTSYGNAYGSGSLPTIWDGGQVIRYGAATFSVVPEPATYALMGTVGLALYLLRRRKAASKG